MAKILIPRSDSISVKIIEPSDFEAFFSNDILNDYVKSGFTLTAGTGLSVNIATGLARLKGLFINNSTSSSKGSLTANDENYIYITLARDSNSEAESWSFTSNLTGTTPTDSLLIGTATTNGSGVTAVNMDGVMTKTTPSNNFGDGNLGNVTISSNTQLGNSDNIRQYQNLTIDATKTLTCGDGTVTKKWILFASESITINGTINLDGRGAQGGVGGAGGAGGSGGVGSNQGANTGNQGGTGLAGSIGSGSEGYNGTGGAGGTGGQGGNGGNNTGSGAGSGGNSASPTSGASSGTNIQDSDQHNFQMPLLVFNETKHWGTGGSGGAGGSGGGQGGSSANQGGGAVVGGNGGAGGTGGAGGNGGGSIILVAPTITFGTNASITCQGVAGSQGNAGGTGGLSSSGGGTGGAGGAPPNGSAGNGQNVSNLNGGGTGGGGGYGGTGGTGDNGFVGLIGYIIPSQSDLNSKSTANIKLRCQDKGL